MILTIDQKQIAPDITVLAMNGRIIMGNTSRDVELKLAEVLKGTSKKIIFDLSGVTQLDSTGVGILVVSQGKITKEGGVMRISGAQGLVANILHMTSVDKLIQSYPTVEEAAAGF